MHRDPLLRYAVLMEHFLEDSITALDFEREYLKTFKEDKTIWTEEEYKILERLFESVDACCSDSALFGQGDINEAELRKEAGIALKELQQLVQ